MPKITEYIFLLLTFVVGITVGLYSATDFSAKMTSATENKIVRNVQDIVLEKIQSEYKLEKIDVATLSGEKDNTEEIKENKKVPKENTNIITVSIDEIKLSPNAEMVIKKNFKLCDHTTENRMNIPIEMVNYTRAEVEKKYTGWNIEKFTQEEVILSKEIEANCDAHYVLKIEEEKLKIYNQITEDKYNYIDEINIQLGLLPSLELAELEHGIEVYGEEELNKLVENYTS